MQVSTLDNKSKMPLYIAAILYFIIFFYLTFPKAGIKIEGIPIALHDILFLFLILFSLTRMADWSATFLQNKRVIILMMIFAIYASLKLGYSFWHAGLLDVGIIIPLLVYPVIFLLLLLFDQVYEMPWDTLLLIPIAAFFILCVYALMQFFMGIENVMVPGLTYNWTDAQDPNILSTKHNIYGPYTKIFSTYQNGNIFGVNLLLIFPLVFELLYERRKSLGYLAMVVFITVAFLTASRAVWAGVFLYVLIRFFLFKQGWKRVLVILPLLFMSSLLLFIEPLRYRANMFLGKDTIPKIIEVPGMDSISEQAGGTDQTWARLHTDEPPQIENLSGRLDNLYRLWDATFGTLNWGAIFFGAYGILPKRSYGIPFEIIYAAIFGYFGLIGLVLWSLPILFSLYNFFKLRDDLVIRGVLLGLICYFIAAMAEGAYWLTPTVFNLWLIIGIGWLRFNYLNQTTRAATI